MLSSGCERRNIQNTTYKVCLLVRRRVLNCVLSAKGVFEKVFSESEEREDQ
jgi:hypothetical protein